MYDRNKSVGKLLTVRNANYKAGIQYMTRISSYILTPIGIWPAVFEGVGRFLPTILIVLCNLALCFTIMPCLLYTIYEEENVVLRMKLIGILSFGIGAGIKFLILALRRPVILQCIKHVEEDWKLVECRLDQETMLQQGQMGRNLTINREDGQFVDHNRTTRHVVYPTYGGFFESQKSPVYELVLGTQLFAEYVMYSTTAGGYSLAALFATHACGQLEVVISHLKNLVHSDVYDEHPDVGFDVKLKTIVQRHLRVLRFANMIETMLQEVCLVEFVGSAFMICLLEYYCITTTDIGETCIMIHWYRLPLNTSRGLILIMCMSSNPVTLTAGRMVNLSISTLGNVLKTSLAYYSFLRTTVL